MGQWTPYRENGRSKLGDEDTKREITIILGLTLLLVSLSKHRKKQSPNRQRVMKVRA